MAKAKANNSACCSIELEPKTLSQGQLYQAREDAADVVQKLEPSEASLVFIDIVERVKPVKQMIEKRGESSLQSPQDYNEGIERCQCSCLCSESPNQLQLLKEPMSAPF